MNPWGLVVIGLGILLVIMGVKGSYENVVAALTGRKHQLTGTTTAATTTPPPAPMPGARPTPHPILA